MRRLAAAVSIATACVTINARARAQAEPAPEPAPTPEPAPAPAPPAPPTAGPPPAAPPPAPAYPPPGGYAYPPGQPPPGYYPGYPPPGYPPPAGVYVETAPPAPVGPPPGHHLHDGFYLRMSIGGSFQKTDVESDTAAGFEVEGGGPGLDILFGGTPTPGLVIGGGVFASTASDPEVTASGATTDFNGAASFLVVGPFVDGFFDPEGGLHVGGAIGIASFQLEADGDPDAEEVKHDGAGAVVFAGYDAFVSSDWSIGGYVRLMGGKGRREETVLGETVEETATTGSFAVLFTALYH